MRQGQQSAPALFYSYSSDDERHVVRLEEHLALLKRQSSISTWYSRKIMPGDDWDESIARQIDLAKIFLLLVSPAFMASEYIWLKELRPALVKFERNEARIVPVIVRPVDWHSAPFGKFQALPTAGRPVTSWGNRDEAWADVARGIRLLVNRL
jgi:hypothetical protein